ncbi:MAG: signal peptidase I, partial [Candidatus Omnitrophota bacterium]
MIISKNGSNNKKLERLTKQIYIDILRKGQPVWLKVFGSSMYPFLQGEDFVHVEGVKTQDIKIGDILIVDNFDKNDAWFFAHRVVKIEKENDEVVFITKGDSNSEGLDEPFNSSSIVGRVFKIEHKDKVMDLRKIFWKKANPFIARMSLRHGRKLRAFAGVIDFAANWRRMHLRLISFALRGDLLKYNADGVILWCVRNLKDRRARASINKLLRMGVSWETLLHICMAQKISVAVYNMLKDYSDAMVPAGVKAQLNKQIFFINQRISGQYRTTIDFIKELNNKGYGLIFFGG